MQGLRYSIIVAVYNRAEEVRELLASAELLDFDRSAFELVFVDDGSSDSFAEMMHQYQSPSGLQIRVMYQQNQGPGAARNLGMRDSKGLYFIFVDSDCMLPPHWLAAIDQEVHEQNLDAFGGPDTYHESFSPLLKAINYSMTSFLGTGGTRGQKKMVGRFYPRSFNMGIHRKVYEALGGMNHLRHGQDMDFSARIYEAGFRVALISKAYVYHKRRTSLGRFFRQIFNWGVARINLGRLHPHLLRPVHLLPALLIAGGTLLVLLSFFLPLSMVWYIIATTWIIIVFVALGQSLLLYRNLSAAFLSVLTLHVQLVAYGLGLWYAILRAALGKQSRGFVKNYYGTKQER